MESARRGRGATRQAPSRGEEESPKRCVRVGRSLKCKPSERETLHERGRSGSYSGFARNRSRRHVPWWSRPRVVALPKTSARSQSSARVARTVAFAKPGMTVHPAVLRKMDPEAGRAVVRTIPVAALVPAKMLVDQAVHIVGRHAVVSPRGFFPRTQDGPVLPGPPSVLPRPAPGAHTAHRSRLLSRRSNFPGASA